MTTERWLPAVGFEQFYSVSDQGRVWSWRTERFLRPGRRGAQV